MAARPRLTDTSPSDGVFDICRACTIERTPGIVAEQRYFGLLTALAAVFVCLATASPAAAAPHVPGELLVKYRAGATEAARTEARATAGVHLAAAVDARTERVTVGGRTDPGGCPDAGTRRQRRPRPAQLRRDLDRLRSQRSRQGRPGGMVGAAVELHGPVRDQRRRRLGQRDRRRQCGRWRRDRRRARHRRRIPHLTRPALPARSRPRAQPVRARLRLRPQQHASLRPQRARDLRRRSDRAGHQQRHRAHRRRLPLAHHADPRARLRGQG